MKKAFLSLILTFALVAPAFAQQQKKAAQNPARAAAENITAAQMRDYLTFVASDEMEGRDTPSRGLDTTAKFIAAMLSRWNVKPAGDNGTSYFQKIELRRDTVDAANSSAKIGGDKFVFGTDFLRLNGATNSDLSAPLVYGGDGWMVKSKNLDALAGVDVTGKIVVVSSNGTPTGFALTPLPQGTSRADLSGKRGEDWADPAFYAQSKGAVGIVVVASTLTENNWAATRDFYARGRARVVKFDDGAAGNVSLPTILITQAMANKLFANEAKNPLMSGDGMSAKPNLAAFELNGKTNFSFNLAIKPETVMTQNVVGMIEGSDAKLKNEMVAIGAHYDHIGISPNAVGDKINNGADDDGSGTTAVLAMAEALAKSAKKPKRSILFVWHCGEEKGLWGSRYFTQFPTVNLKNVVTQLNIDMIGRSKTVDDTNPLDKNLSAPNQIYVIGSRMMSDQLGDVSEKTNNSYLKLNFDYRYDDPKDPNRFFFRSDHFNYARTGIPIIFYFDGEHQDYHRPGDEVQKIDFDKMQLVARTVFATMWAIGDLPQRPVVNRQLSADRLQR